MRFGFPIRKIHHHERGVGKKSAEGLSTGGGLKDQKVPAKKTGTRGSWREWVLWERGVQKTQGCRGGIRYSTRYTRVTISGEGKGDRKAKVVNCGILEILWAGLIIEGYLNDQRLLS